MVKNKGLAFKLIVLILSSTGLIFSIILYYNYSVAKKIVLNNVENNTINLALATVNKIESVLYPIERITRNFAMNLEYAPAYSEIEFRNILSRAVLNDPEVTGRTIALEPGIFTRNTENYALYCYKDTAGANVQFMHLDYDFYYDDWYQIPKELNQPIWSEPYYDEGGSNILMATYAVPIYRVANGKKSIAGVVTADISLEWLKEIVSSIKIYDTGYAFLISRNGTIITHPRNELIMNETIFSIAESRQENELRTVGRDMVRGGKGFVPINGIITERKAWIAYEPLPSNSWSLGVLFPESELLADLRSLQQILIILSIIGFVCLGAVIVFITGRITRPLRQLAMTSETIGQGNLDAEIPALNANDEVGLLAHSFVSMQHSLKEYISQLVETTAAKERIESDLKAAHDIQMSILPRMFPAFPNRKEFELHAIIEPAKEVGGDFYDFFFIDDDHICVCIGDVSGKGVPASLFMAVTKTLIKAKSSKGLTPDTVLARVNEDLCIDNAMCMFVTLFLGILNVKTGEIEYSIGGHNLPYIIRAGGGVEIFEKTKGMALGVMDGCDFGLEKATLGEGDTIYLYTDGVNEAENEEHMQYECPRLEDLLKSCAGKAPMDVTMASLKDVKEFVSGAPQSDDITILVLRFGRDKGGR